MCRACAGLTREERRAQHTRSDYRARPRSLDGVPAKPCGRCRVVKPLDAFSRAANRLTGRHQYCLDCRRELGAIWRKENAEKIKGFMARDRLRHPERFAEQDRRQREKAHTRRVDNNRDRAARLRSAFVEPVSYSQVFARDEGRCSICGADVDPSLGGRHRMRGSVDHVVPLSRGGTHEMANVRLAHFSCNARKGNRPTALGG